MKIQRTIGSFITVFALTPGVLLATAGAASADGTARFMTTGTSGWAEAYVTTSQGNAKYSLKGTFRDNKSGDDCTKLEVWARKTDNTYRRDIVTKRLCGGLSTSFTAAGDIAISWGPDIKEIGTTVCQDKTLAADVCRSSSLNVQ